MNREQVKNLSSDFRHLALQAADFVESVFSALSDFAERQETAASTGQVGHSLPGAKVKQVLTKREVAELLQISVRTVNEQMNEGLPYFKMNKAVRFNREQVLQWTAGKEIKGRQKTRLRVVR
jgi:excisionase family DNA binding protein